MPRGYYLAQGLIPLGYSSSDDEEGPCELPDGRLVCGPHGLVTCGKCCTDYSFMEDVLGEDDEDDEDAEDDEERADNKDFKDEVNLPNIPPPSAFRVGHDMIRGTGIVFPTTFEPRANTQPPLELFSGRRRHILATRYTYPSDNSILLLMTDGACLNNGQANPRAGWAFFQGLNHEGNRVVVSGRLEQQGPWGDDGMQTSNRAELRAVIAALRSRHWPGEGFHTVVIATDSEYVVEGSTRWSKTWVRNNWKTRSRSREGGYMSVKNKDLWEVLLGECERAHGNGMAVRFWKIPREWNELVDEHAKRAAEIEEAPEGWVEVMGVPI
ncbi:RNase H domain protein [Stachybotrys elegans]|uniref:ribonuclease H n=1 Tax=Stachybotrys elegans TaxID=80388 RepID=A0A8K0WL50_9HYPO|nr:RNase H domain protein [Stachybotrys elegans]